jgi:hypothetical protein
MSPEQPACREYTPEIRITVIEKPLVDAPHEGAQFLIPKFDPSDDAQLIATIRAGDQEAFTDLVRPYLTLFTVGIQRILQNEPDTQIALQGALLSIRTELHLLKAGTRFSTWAYRICLNEALMLRRSRVRQVDNDLEPCTPW